MEGALAKVGNRGFLVSMQEQGERESEKKRERERDTQKIGGAVVAH